MKARLFTWFWIGFIATFVLLGLFVKILVMMPNGAAVRPMSLLVYYVSSINNMIEPRPLGPATPDMEHVVIMLLEHASLALVGGVIALFVGWIVERNRSKTGPAS
jgi:hypothetical protein